MTASSPVSTDIAIRIAEREGVEITELQPPLYECIDTDALNELIADPAFSSEDNINFPYRNHMIRVTGCGTVEIRTEDD